MLPPTVVIDMAMPGLPERLPGPAAVTALHHAGLHVRGQQVVGIVGIDHDAAHESLTSIASTDVPRLAAVGRGEQPTGGRRREQHVRAAAERVYVG